MNNRLIQNFFLLILFTVLGSCGNNTNESSSTTSNIPVLGYSTIKSYPHDTNSFTEGFMFYEGKLFESTGATDNLPQTRSLFGIVDLETGKIDTKVELERDKYFGEGISILNGKIFQLTYRNKIGFIYNVDDYKKIGTFNFPCDEGWGFTNDGSNLIMSDGTNFLYYLDPNNYKMFKKISVSENGNATDYLNELEYIDGYIFANIWTKNDIVKIDPSDGKIVAKLNLDNLANDAKSIFPGSLEMNGIAYDTITKRLLVTGKLWPKIYEIKIN